MEKIKKNAIYFLLKGIYAGLYGVKRKEMKE